MTADASEFTMVDIETLESLAHVISDGERRGVVKGWIHFRSSKEGY